MLLDVLIVEDNSLFLNANRRYIEQIMNTYQIEMHITCFTNAGDRLDTYIKEQNIDLAVLDIEIGRKSGLSVGKKIISYHPLSSIIFITSHGEFIKKANSLCPVGFLDKPVEYAKLERLMYRVIMEKKGAESIEEGNAKIITLKRNREDIDIRETEILYIRILGRKLQVVLKTDSFCTNNSISNVYEKMSDRFAKISRDIIVNKREVASIEKGKVVMSNQDILEIPIFKYKEIVQMIRS